jgi:hypothetical protein
MSPLRLINDGSFDAETTRLMAEAYEDAARALGTAVPLLMKEALARRIIEAARKGERDRLKLKSYALQGLDKSPDTG